MSLEVIIRVIRDNSCKLNFLLLLAKIYKMVKGIFEKIKIMYY